MENMALNQLFAGVYLGRRVLITGHTGFKGSWLAAWLVQMGADVTGISLDPETNPSHWTALSPHGVYDRRIDLLDAPALDAAITECRPEIVFHLAAQALVRRSYADPIGTYASNLMGLVNLLESVRRCPSVRAVVNATTDKVYADKPTAGGYREADDLGGHDPYSTSKACAELICESYRKSFFDAGVGRVDAVRLATARAGNVIGGGDWAEDRLVPDLVRAGSSGQPLKIRNPDAVRPWQHVLEPLSGYLRLGQMLLGSCDFVGAWNFGPGSDGEISVRQLAERFHQSWPALSIEPDAKAQPHEAALLRLDCGKASTLLQWRPLWDIDTTVQRTSTWYRDFYHSGFLQTSNDITAYVTRAQREGLSWAV